MRLHLSLPVALALLLTGPAIARAQSMDGGGEVPAGFASPALYLLLQIYGIQQQQLAAMPQAERDELAKRAAQYFTNGAEVTGVPTSGPGAAYFQNGAEVTAASTAQAIPFGVSAFPTAEAEIDAAPGAAVALPAPAPSGSLLLDAAVSRAPETNAKGANGVAPDGGAAAAEPNPSEPTAVPPGRVPSVTPTEMEAPVANGSPPAPNTTLAAFRAAADSSLESPRLRGALGLMGALFGGIGVATLLVFLAARVGAPRMRPPSGENPDDHSKLQ